MCVQKFCFWTNLKVHFIFQVDIPLKPHRRSDSGNTSKEVLLYLYVCPKVVFLGEHRIALLAHFYHTGGSNSPEMVLDDPRDPERTMRI